MALGNFCSWLIHATTSTWFDAEAATSTVEHAIGLGTSAVVRHIRGVPEDSPRMWFRHQLSPMRDQYLIFRYQMGKAGAFERCGLDWRSRADLRNG